MSAKYEPDIHHRRSVRLPSADYGAAGAYFITICMQDREHLFGEILNAEIRLSDAGRMIQLGWDELPTRFPRIQLDAFVVMPNHIHAIVVLAGMDEPTEGEHKVRPLPSEPISSTPRGTLPDTIGRIAQAFKSSTTHKYTLGVKQFAWPPFAGRLWQRGYYERIIRNERELEATREYIYKNPDCWAEDRYDHAKQEK